MPSDALGTPIGSLTAITGSSIDADADVLPVSDISVGATRKITVKELIANTSSFLQSGTGAGASRSVQTELRELVFNVKSGPFGATGDGVTDDTTAIGNAISAAETAGGGIVYFPKGTYLIGSQLSVTDAKYLLLLGTGFGSQIKKGFNGAMISLGKRSRMEHLYLNGDGATRTGRGVIVSTGSASDPASARFIERCYILDTESYCVEYTAAQAGYGSEITNSWLIPRSTSTPAVKFPNDAAGTGNRLISECFTDSSEICDLGSAENTRIIGCNGTGPLFSGTALKTTITACRIGANATALWTVKGNSTVITGCLISPTAITFHADMVNCKVKCNNITAGATITDNAPGVSQNNEIDYDYATYTPTWTAAGDDPSLGNGTITGIYSRRGQWARVKVLVVAGSTTTFGTGGFEFTLPYNASNVATGSGFVQDVTGSFYGGVTSFIDNSNNLLRLIKAGAVTDFISGTDPFTFASGDFIRADIEYSIA